MDLSGSPTITFEPPIRSELFSIERLEQHADSLAKAQHVVSGRRKSKGRPIAPRLHDNSKVLRETYRAIVVAARAGQPVSPAAEWLLDNFHVVDEQIRDIENDLPPGFYRLLPKLAEGPLAGYPRVFGIAWAVIAHSDSAFEIEKLTRFVDAYQRVQPLTIGELWALAITLRITLVENLRRLAESIVARLAATQLADTLADKILNADSASAASAALQELQKAPWSTAFAVQLAQRLRDRDPQKTSALRWLNDRFAQEHTTADQLVREEVQRQSATNVTVRNIITSMRLVSMVNWPEFFESVSTVDRILRDGSNFKGMDFQTRDLYRRAIEEMARGSAYDEQDIARRAVSAAKRPQNQGTESDGKPKRESDPGYYLIGHGREGFETEIASHAPFKTRVLRSHSRLGVKSYIGLIALFSLVALVLASLAVWHAGIHDWRLVVLALVGIIPASDVAVAFVNRILTGTQGARPLPGMDLRDGIPADMRTIVVVPTLLTSLADIDEQIERIEVHHLSNPDDNLVFALLSDWKDAPSEHAPDDDLLLEEARARIAKLNAHYGPARGSARFFLLHRRRVWNEGEGAWIGWERKRGKLHELNRLLRGATDTTFITVDQQRPPTDIGYVITLDADTRMPIGTARRLVGKMAHPLNRPQFDPARGLVVRGHAILQPRVTPSLPIGKEGSLFQRVFSGPNGLDPYAAAVSDVYQDLYEQGSYVGKGIYHIDTFEAALHGQIPESAVLSHDLLEGIFSRAGLVTDIEVVEEFPSRYDVSAARQHRWTRGDWQLLPWIFGSRSRARNGTQPTKIPLIGRWKLIDNLRRSLSAPAALLSLLIAWTLPLHAGIVWTCYILSTIVFPPILPAIAGLTPPKIGVSLGNHFRAIGRDFSLGILQSVFLVTFLAHQAWLMVDAMGRTLVRLFVHRKKLLEWVTAAQARRNATFDRRDLITQIVASIAFAVVVGFIIAAAGHKSWPIAVPFAILWVFSPVAARWASMPPYADGHLSIRSDDVLALRLIARRTWNFFEKFVVAEDNFLPPDNFQETPSPVVARRTSPTNIGLYLLSVVAARDFGWLGTTSALDRLESTLATLDKMEQHRGHFYNWYATADLHPLEPKYISSVDSGNLAGHLIALANACCEIAVGPVLNPRWCRGLLDDIALAAEDARTGGGRDARLSEAFSTFIEKLNEPPESASAIAQLLANLEADVDPLLKIAQEGNVPSEAIAHLHAMRASIRAHRADLALLMPWTSLPECADHEAVVALNQTPNIDGLSDHCEIALRHLSQYDAGKNTDTLTDALEKSRSAAQLVRHRLSSIAERARTMALQMEFGFLFDPDRQMLAIGYRCNDGTLDPNFYDMLASEARLASFFAIAKGDVPAKHWFRLGRTLTPIEGGSGLISWSGSMFEYLMPSLVMRAPSGSLLEQTNRLVVKRQEDYGDELGVPWGISESAFNARNIEQTYQYSSFGVPDLGYKRGLSNDTVIAPYATGLATMIDPTAAARNYERMARLGARGAYGWYEAIDYTRSRLPEGQKFAIVRCYMAHHQAMSLIAICNALHDGTMRTRFHTEPIIQAAELLLQERMPRDIALARQPPEQIQSVVQDMTLVAETERRYHSAHSRVPRTQILSNGRYATMLTASGSGYSRWHDVALTRWREDVTRDQWGAYIYLRDVRNGEVWSAGYQPTATEPDSYEVVFSEDRAEIIRSDGSITTMLEVLVSPEDDAEVRRVSITNHGVRTREIEITSFAEVALSRQPDDVSHPAFAKLFVETEFAAAEGAILATRRQRSDGDPKVWAAHLAVVEGESSGDVQFETDRARFLGRGQTARGPAAIVDGWPLSNTAGPVLDPIFSLRRRIQIPRGATVRIAFWTMAADSRDGIVDLVDKHRDTQAFDRASTLAWTQAQMQLRHLGVSPDEANLFQRLANHVFYIDPTLRPPADVIKRGMRKASTLWAHGISGDLPIVLVRVQEDEDLKLVRQLLRAHEYWRLKQLAVDLVIFNERATSYAQDFQGTIDALVRTNQAMPKLASDSTRGAVFVLRTDQIPPESRNLLLAAARAILTGGSGTLMEQINRAREKKPGSPPPVRRSYPQDIPEAPLPNPPMEFFNGMGGFTKNGREYLTVLDGRQRTPAPWINVVANPQFGFIASTDGGGFTWSLNAQQNAITPWSNDSVSDPPGEVLYIRDEETGELWTPTALPIREPQAPYAVAHGQGYSRFEHTSHGIALEMTQFVPKDDPVKISRLKISNRSGRARRISVTSYVEWVLGANRSATQSYVVTEVDAQTGALFASNPWHEQFGERVAFCDLNGKQTAWTCDRTEFLGRDGALDFPRALAPGSILSNKSGAGLDPCGVLQMPVRLSAAGTTEIVFVIGQAGSSIDARALISKYRTADLDAAFADVTGTWNETLNAVQVKTPDRALDILMNRWLPYQVLTCRVWGRTGFYQASGAYGFRDQLQDVMALCVSRPEIARAHILRAAGRQFVEGDVQHWWLPESGRGIRTRMSDDRAWLAYVTAHYVNTTGDAAVLDEMVPFLEGPVLHEGEHDAFFEPTVSERKVSLFDHCALALDKSLATGAHGLPLMGTGDWNDGMDRVGENGKGESVWLGWLLCSTLNAFAVIADRRDPTHATAWRDAAAKLKTSIENEAWDGDWYRRAYFDDGSPLGSVTNTECRLDSIAQSWAVVSRAGDPARTARAMEAVDKYLVRRDEKLSMLFTPPFNHPQHDPGYIRGYPPGIRENGGQYTHASAWAALAFAMQGDGDKAAELLSMLNPINHSSDQTGMYRYRVEPYAVCADIYSMPPHVGRGGWTWYTGSAGWVYRTALEWLLGFRLQGDTLAIDPCIPRSWPGFEITYRHRTAKYEISVENPLGVCHGILAAKLDGKMLEGQARSQIALADDGATHQLQIILG
ncbi:MAG TPA: glucoamylase family protein [Rhizomicrobium sp.]|nr:glucoamylase family protein [Rhizomicrobium sp.]